MIFPVVAYAPTAATKPSIAAQPLKRSASGVMIVYLLCVNCVLFCVLNQNPRIPKKKKLPDVT